MCQRGALGSWLERLTAGSGGALGGKGDVGGMMRLAGGLEFDIIGRLGVAMSSVGWYDGIVTRVRTEPSNVLEFVFSVQVPSIVLKFNSMFSNVLETKCLENAVILAVYWRKELNKFAHPTTSGKKKARPEQLPNECSAAVGFV